MLREKLRARASFIRAIESTQPVHSRALCVADAKDSELQRLLPSSDSSRMKGVGSSQTQLSIISGEVAAPDCRISVRQLQSGWCSRMSTTELKQTAEQLYDAIELWNTTVVKMEASALATQESSLLAPPSVSSSAK